MGDTLPWTLYLVCLSFEFAKRRLILYENMGGKQVVNYVVVYFGDLQLCKVHVEDVPYLVKMDIVDVLQLILIYVLDVELLVYVND